MAQQIKIFAAKPDVKSIPRIYKGRKRNDFYKLSSALHMGMCVYPKCCFCRKSSLNMALNESLDISSNSR